MDLKIPMAVASRVTHGLVVDDDGQVRPPDPGEAPSLARKVDLLTLARQRIAIEDGETLEDAMWAVLRTMFRQARGGDNLSQKWLLENLGEDLRPAATGPQLNVFGGSGGVAVQVVTNVPTAVDDSPLLG